MFVEKSSLRTLRPVFVVARPCYVSTSIAWPQWSFMVESLQDQLIWWSRDSNPLQGPVVGLTRPEMSLAIFSMTAALASKDAWVPKSMTVDQSAEKPGSARGFPMRQLDFWRCSFGPLVQPYHSSCTELVMVFITNEYRGNSMKYVKPCKCFQRN